MYPIPCHCILPFPSFPCTKKVDRRIGSILGLHHIHSLHCKRNRFRLARVFFIVMVLHPACQLICEDVSELYHCYFTNIHCYCISVRRPLVIHQCQFASCNVSAWNNFLQSGTFHKSIISCIWNAIACKIYSLLPKIVIYSS